MLSLYGESCASCCFTLQVTACQMTGNYECRERKENKQRQETKTDKQKYKQSNRQRQNGQTRRHTGKQTQVGRLMDRQTDSNAPFVVVQVAVWLHDNRLLWCPFTANLAARRPFIAVQDRSLRRSCNKWKRKPTLILPYLTLAICTPAWLNLAIMSA